MKHRPLAILMLFLASLALATQAIGSVAKAESQEQAIAIPQEKWVVIPLGAIDSAGQPYTITLLLRPDQVCDAEGRSEKEKAQCYEHWKLLPYEQYPLQSDEIEMPYGSTLMRTTEASLCILIRGIHRTSSSGSPVDSACHALWEKYSKGKK